MIIRKSEIRLIDSTDSSIEIEWDIDERIQLTGILLNVIEHKTQKKHLGTILISNSASGYEIQCLQPNTLYEIKIAAKDAKRQYSWSNLLFTHTKNPPYVDLLYPSEKLLKEIPVETRELINARNIKDWKDYVNCGYKFAKPKEIRQQLLSRALIWADSIDKLEETYDLNDDYFQGPFVKTKKRPLY